MKPLKVLDLRDTDEIGGPGKTILETYRAVDAKRFELSVGVFGTEEGAGNTPFARAARDCGMPVHVIPATGPYDGRQIWRLAHLVKTEGISVVHAHEASSDVLTYLASALHRVPIVSTAHGWIGNGAKQQLFVALDKLVLRRFDRVIAVSAKLQGELIAAGVPERKVHLLHNAIVLDRYRRNGSNGFIEQRIGQRPRGPVLASIGRLSPEKGHLDLVEALGIVTARGHQVTAVFVGDGPERPRIEERIKALGLTGSIHLLGYLDQTARILQDADLMVLPSHTEGLPNAALEAMAMEVPVLATRVGGTPEVVTDGLTGRLVEARSPASLADAIGDFVANPGEWKAMADRARPEVERRFDFHARTRRLEEIYTQLAAEGNR